jgi:hypothetical protein
VKVLSAGAAGVSLDPERLAACDALAWLNDDRREMRVEREESWRVLDVHDVAPAQVAPIGVAAIEVARRAATEGVRDAVCRGDDDVGRQRRRRREVERETPGW